MREEIRNWLRGASSFPDTLVLTAIIEKLEEYRGLPITEFQAKQLRARLLEIAKNTIEGWAFSSSRERLIGTNYVSKVDSYYHWRPLEYLVINPPEGTEDSEQYRIKAFELRYTDIAVDRKRIIYDDYPANISITEHALCRMIERGAVASRPLQYTKDTFYDWYPMAIILLAYQKYFDLKKGRGFIPIPGGALLVRVVSSPIERDKKHPSFYSKRRVFADRYGRSAEYIPFESAFDFQDEKEGPSYNLIQIATYINSEKFRPSQESIYDQMMSFSKRYASHLKYYPLLSKRQTMNRKEGLDHDLIKDMGLELYSIASSPEWEDACAAG